MSGTISHEFWAFLQLVDAPKERPKEFLQQVARTLLANNTTDQYDLIGFEFSVAKKGAHNNRNSLLYLAPPALLQARCPMLG